MEKSQALNAIHAIHRQWDFEKDPKCKTELIQYAKEALETLETQNDQEIKEVNGRLIADILRRLTSARDELGTVANDCPIIPYYGRVHELTEYAKTAIDAVIYEVSPCLKPAQEKPKKPIGYVMSIHFHKIPEMGYSPISQQRYLNELAERHNVQRVCVTGSNQANIYYRERDNADAVLNELHKDNAGPRIDLSE